MVAKTKAVPVCAKCNKKRRDGCECPEGTPGSLKEKHANPKLQTKKKKDEQSGQDVGHGTGEPTTKKDKVNTDEPPELAAEEHENSGVLEEGTRENTNSWQDDGKKCNDKSSVVVNWMLASRPSSLSSHHRMIVTWGRVIQSSTSQIQPISTSTIFSWQLCMARMLMPLNWKPEEKLYP